MVNQKGFREAEDLKVKMEGPKAELRKLRRKEKGKTRVLKMYNNYRAELE